MIITYPPGGTTDLGGRVIAKSLEKQFGVSVVIENVEGASGAVGTGRVASAKPDGLTIGVTTGSAASRVPLIEDVGYQLEDLAPIGMAALNQGLVYVPQNSKYKTAEEFFQAAKDNPSTIKMGTSGAQSPQQVEMERLADEYGVKFRLVPFDGETLAITSLLGNNVDAVITTNGVGALAQVESGKLRVLAVGSQDRLDYVPDAPTFSELGYDSLIYAASTYIFVAPAGTPKKIIDMLEDGLEKALSEEETIKVIGEVRIPPKFIGAEALAAQMKDEREVLEPILKKLFG